MGDCGELAFKNKKLKPRSFYNLTEKIASVIMKIICCTDHYEGDQIKQCQYNKRALQIHLCTNAHKLS